MKIGFLAMSGIRAHDPELVALGLTMPGVLDRGKVIARLPSLGLLYLAAITPPGHELHYFEAEGDGKEPAEVYECDLVAISTFSAQVNEAYAVADRLRARGVTVAMGGLHVSVRPDEAAAHADHVLVGEGENVWPEVVRAVEAGEQSRIWSATDFPPVDVKRLPVPRYDLLRDRPYTRFTVQTTRGCPWRCDFCASNVMLRQPYRKRPVDQVVRDIRAVMAVRPKPFIEFADDNTFVDKAWGKELCRALAPLDIHWFTETDISVADDEELLTLMRQAGCRQVLIGLESTGADELNGVELRSNFKAARAGRYLDAVRRIQDHGITVNGCFVLGLDGHTPDVFGRVLDFAETAPLFDAQVTLMTAFPGTPLYDRLLNENRLLDPNRWDLCTLFDVNYRPKGMSVDELRSGMRWLVERLYSPEALDRRRRGYFERWHANSAS
jgi:radical SAM superfamily enzyme YgiQ (UPF0313 family)